MTETDTAPDRSSLVPGVHRLIRALDGKEGPFAGTLVAFGDAVAVCVDVDALKGWPGWAFSDAQHVCGVQDIRRRADGHDALLPWCTERVESFLGRRSATDSPLSPGELGTLVASLLRGVREVGTDAEGLGDWWLTGEGRPLFVYGQGGSARARTALLVERIGAEQGDRSTARVLEEITTALRQPRHPVEDDRRWEAELFARAAPRALQTDVFAPERVSAVTSRFAVGNAAAGAPTAEGTRRRERMSSAGDERRRGERPRSRAARRAGKVGARRAVSRKESLRTLAGSAFDGLHTLRQWRASRSAPRPSAARSPSPAPKPSRRRSVLIAAGAGAAVLLVGLLWPDAERPAEAASGRESVAVSEASPDDTSDSRETTPTPSTLPTPSAPEDAPDSGTALDAVASLLDQVATCVADGAEACPEAVAEGARVPDDGLASHGASASTATLVDDYGDVAVLRLMPNDAEAVAEQMIVLERRNEIWLVRDVYDVAHQPD